MSDTLTTLRKYADAWTRNDLAQVAALYADSFTLHYPGTHALAGVHRGKREALRVLGEVSRRVQRRLVRVIDVMAGEQRGALQVVEEWRRDGEAVQLERMLVYTTRDGLLTECWLFDADQTAVARLLRTSAA